MFGETKAEDILYQERIDTPSQLVTTPTQRLASSVLPAQPRRDQARPPLPPSRYSAALPFLW